MRKVEGTDHAPPRGRQYTPIYFRDADAIATKLRALSEDLTEISRSVSSAEEGEQEAIRKRVTDLSLERGRIEAEQRVLWFKKSISPQAMALYEWIRQRTIQLREICRSEGDRAPRMDEWLEAEVYPLAALIGLLWYPVDFQLEVGPPPDLGGRGWDWRAYGEAVLAELSEAEEGMDHNLVVAVGQSLYQKSAGVFIQLSNAQETADFLGVGGGRSSALPSAKA